MSHGRFAERSYARDMAYRFTVLRRAGERGWLRTFLFRALEPRYAASGHSRQWRGNAKRHGALKDCKSPRLPMHRLEIALISLVIALCAGVFATPWREMHVAIDGYSGEVAMAEHEYSLQTDVSLQPHQSDIVSPVKMAGHWLSADK
jgi:hypothetical protein